MSDISIKEAKKMGDSFTSTDMKRLIEKYPENFTGEILQSSRARTPKQEAAEQEAITQQIKTLEELAAPLVEWIREYYTPYTAVLVSWDSVSVKHEGIRIPFPYSEK
jgi:hypothetical protein